MNYNSEIALDDTQKELDAAEAKIELLEAALNEAAEFALKRLPQDMRGGDAKYYRELFLGCAAAKLNSQRSVENVG